MDTQVNSNNITYVIRDNAGIQEINLEGYADFHCYIFYKNYQ
jgi:hypothetical protein